MQNDIISVVGLVKTQWLLDFGLNSTNILMDWIELILFRML